MIDPTKFPKARGNKELRKHILGDRLSLKKAVLAKCADCMGYYFDGRFDCQMPDCPLYPFMPYRVLKPDTLKKTSQKRLDALAKARLSKNQDSLSV